MDGREEGSQIRHRRDQLLEVTAKATNVLLTLDNFDEAMMTALKIIGEGIDCDHIKILENIFEVNSTLPTHFTFVYEWLVPEFIRDRSQLESACIPTNQLDVAFLEDYFLNGDGFDGPLEVWPEALQNIPATNLIQSGYTVPIWVNGQWWGMLSFHYCRAAIEISPTEVSVLMTIADCVGSAIERNRLQKEREQAAQQRATELEEYNQRLLRRDKLLEVTAKATNVLLTLDSIDTALKILIEGTSCDRIEILENVYESSSPIRFVTSIQFRND